MELLKEKLPLIDKVVSEGAEVIHWDNYYHRERELSKEQKVVVSDMEEKGKEVNLKVVAVVSGRYMFPGELEYVTMTAYVYIDNQTPPWEIDDDTFGFMAFVVNPAWDVEEHGSVGIVEENGFIRRTM